MSSYKCDDPPRIGFRSSKVHIGLMTGKTAEPMCTDKNNRTTFIKQDSQHRQQGSCVDAIERGVQHGEYGTWPSERHRKRRNIVRKPSILRRYPKYHANGDCVPTSLGQGLHPYGDPIYNLTRVRMCASMSSQ